MKLGDLLKNLNIYLSEQEDDEEEEWSEEEKRYWARWEEKEREAEEEAIEKGLPRKWKEEFEKEEKMKEIVFENISKYLNSPQLVEKYKWEPILKEIMKNSIYHYDKEKNEVVVNDYLFKFELFDWNYLYFMEAYKKIGHLFPKFIINSTEVKFSIVPSGGEKIAGRKIIEHLINNFDFKKQIIKADITYSGISDLRNLKGILPPQSRETFYVLYNGELGVNNCNLDSLEGAPKKILCEPHTPSLVEFSCRNCNLKSLKGAPEIIQGSFDCSYNNLISLDGIPKRVEGDFIMKFNKGAKFTQEDIEKRCRVDGRIILD